MLFVQTELKGARGDIVVVDVLEACFVECEVGFAELEVIGDRSLIGGAVGKGEGRWECSERSIDCGRFAGWKDCSGGGCRGVAGAVKRGV